MTFLADESVDNIVVRCLRDAGYVVNYVAELDPGIDDNAVLELARQSQSILITADKDFGELVVRQRKAAAGVVLLRLAGLSAEKKAGLALATINQHASQMASAFTVIAPGRVRIRIS